MVHRQRVWIDRHVQGVLVGRVVLYWACGLVYLALGSACFQFWRFPDWTMGQHAQELLSQFGPWIPSLVLVMPLVIFDVLRLSHLFTGPIYRLRRHLQLLSSDANCGPLKFRTDDYWQDLVQPINQLQSEILQLRELVAKQNTLLSGAPPADRKVGNVGEVTHQEREDDVDKPEMDAKDFLVAADAAGE